MIALPPSPSSASLTPMQQRFQADPKGCQETLRRRADGLFETGYRAVTAATPLVFVVRHEARGRDPRDGAACYLVHAIKRTCSCPFFTHQRVAPLAPDGSVVPCKHLLGLEKLVQESAVYFKQVNDLYEYLRLLGHWMAVLAEEHRRGSSHYASAFAAIPTTATTTEALPEEVQKGNRP